MKLWTLTAAIGPCLLVSMLATVSSGWAKGPASRPSSQPSSQPSSRPSSRPSSQPAREPRAVSEVEGLTIVGAVLRLPPGGRGAGALYMTIESSSTKSDRLVGAETSAAKHVMLHETVMKGDVAKMVHAEHWTLPARGRLVLERGGRHIMLMGLDGKLRPGDRTEVIVLLDEAGPVRLMVPVKSLVD